MGIYLNLQVINIIGLQIPIPSTAQVDCPWKIGGWDSYQGASELHGKEQGRNNDDTGIEDVEYTANAGNNYPY